MIWSPLRPCSETGFVIGDIHMWIASLVSYCKPNVKLIWISHLINRSDVWLDQFIVFYLYFNILNYSKHTQTNSVIDILYTHCFLSQKKRPTRIAKESATLRDNIFTKCYPNIDATSQCFIYTDVSDYFLIVRFVDFGMKHRFCYEWKKSYKFLILQKSYKTDKSVKMRYFKRIIVNPGMKGLN